MRTRTFLVILTLLLAGMPPVFPNFAFAEDPYGGLYPELSERDWERMMKEGRKTGALLVILWYDEQKDQTMLGGKRPSEVSIHYLRKLRYNPTYLVNLRTFSLSGRRKFADHIDLPKALQGKIPLLVEYSQGVPIRIAWLDREMGEFSVPSEDFRNQEMNHWLKEE